MIKFDLAYVYITFKYSIFITKKYLGHCQLYLINRKSCEEATSLRLQLPRHGPEQGDSCYRYLELFSDSMTGGSLLLEVALERF